MGKHRKNDNWHILYRPVKSPRHLIEFAKNEKWEIFQIIALTFLSVVIIFSFRKTISVIQAAGEIKDKIDIIEKNYYQYASEYNLTGCKLRKGEKIKFSENPTDVLACEEFFDEICSICGKTEKELALEEKANREFEIQVERGKARARLASALARRRAAAPSPVSAINVNGRLVCAKKNDTPRVSKENNNGMHWDRECCLDPDEWPNPWCTY
jgi:hypothetical protein